MQQLGFDLLQNAELQEHAMHHFLYTPLANTFTLGIYGMVAPPAAAGPADMSEGEPTDL